VAIPFTLDGRDIVLIDTPGFDDDVRSDVQILEDIARWLSKKGYMKENLLDGVIFLHPITLNRVGGSERKRTRLLEKILGSSAYNRVIIATTMWDDLRSQEAVDMRLEGRLKVGGVWHEMCSKGATIARHTNDPESAHEIIRKVIRISDNLGKVQPLLQEELKVTRGRVNETSAGKELRHQLEGDVRLIKQQLEKHDEDRPPPSYKRDKDMAHRNEWKEWHKERKMMKDRLELREEQLKRLGSMVVSTFTTVQAKIFLHQDDTNFLVQRFDSSFS